MKLKQRGLTVTLSCMCLHLREERWDILLLSILVHLYTYLHRLWIKGREIRHGSKRQLGEARLSGSVPVFPFGNHGPASEPFPISPESADDGKGATFCQPSGVVPFSMMPLCYFNEPCTWCKAPLEDRASPAVAVTAKEAKLLMDAHVRFGHRNFKSLAKALNLRMPRFLSVVHVLRRRARATLNRFLVR